jgi:hypothetical protein
MKPDVLDRIMLIAVALLLSVIALHPLASPAPAYAEAEASRELYIEPGTTLLRAPDSSTQVMGKVVIDLGTGKVWGFPTLTDKPYPVDTIHTVPPVSHPIYLGRLNFSEITN